MSWMCDYYTSIHSAPALVSQKYTIGLIMSGLNVPQLELLLTFPFRELKGRNQDLYAI